MVPGGNGFSPLQLDGEAFVKGILVFLLRNVQLCGDKLHMITINRFYVQVLTEKQIINLSNRTVSDATQAICQTAKVHVSLKAGFNCETFSINYAA